MTGFALQLDELFEAVFVTDGSLDGLMERDGEAPAVGMPSDPTVIDGKSGNGGGVGGG